MGAPASVSGAAVAPRSYLTSRSLCPAAAGSAGCCSASAAAEPAPRSARRSSSPDRVVAAGERRRVGRELDLGGRLRPAADPGPTALPRRPAPRSAVAAVGRHLRGRHGAPRRRLGDVPRVASPSCSSSPAPSRWCRPASPGSPRSTIRWRRAGGLVRRQVAVLLVPAPCWSSTPCSSRCWPGRSARSPRRSRSRWYRSGSGWPSPGTGSTTSTSRCAGRSAG